MSLAKEDWPISNSTGLAILEILTLIVLQINKNKHVHL
jgi:hypothetical protein